MFGVPMGSSMWMCRCGAGGRGASRPGVAFRFGVVDVLSGGGGGFWPGGIPECSRSVPFVGGGSLFFVRLPRGRSKVRQSPPLLGGGKKRRIK